MLRLLLTYNFGTQCKELQKTKKVSGLQLRPSNRVTWLYPQEERWCLQKQGGSNLKSNFAGMDLKSPSANITPNFISMCVLLVKVSYAGSKKQISTYAMLDNCSQGCFVKDSIRKNLGANGRKTEITIKTLNGEQKMKSTVMSGLKVRSDSDGDTKRWLDLPATYTKEELPADVEEVPTRE